jgi:hypothetical protein
MVRDIGLGFQRTQTETRLLQLLVTIFAIVFLLASQFKLLASLTTGLWHINIEQAQVNQHENENEQKRLGNNKNYFTNTTPANVSCDSSPCNGFFAYDGPNMDKIAALDVFEKAVSVYNYGPEKNSETKNKMIFMPNMTNHQSCVREWKESIPKWRDR